MQTLQDYQQTQGAVVDEAGHLRFGNEAAAIAAAEQAVALYDRSHWGLLAVGGSDRLTFLHNQSTNDCKRLQPGQGCDTVILTSTARTLDLVSAYATDTEVLLLTSPHQGSRLLTWLDRYIFFGDKVELSDRRASTLCFSLLGPQSGALLQQIGIDPLPQPLHSHHLAVTQTDLQMRVAAGSGLATPGYTILADCSDGIALWQCLTAAGAVPLGENAWEQLRVQQGRPMPGSELTEDYNPLEAGLWHTVSFNKGCYIGQETIARLNTYNGVKQQLWGFHLDAPVPAGTILYDGDQRVGLLTSVVETATRPLGLGYLKTKVGGAGLVVQTEQGTPVGVAVEVPFLTRSPQSVATP